MRVLPLLFLVPIVLPCAAEPARHSEQFGNIRVATVSKQPEETWCIPVAVWVMRQANGERCGTAGSGNLDHFVGAVRASLIWRP